MQSIDDIEVSGRRVLVRSDLNVPLDKSGSGKITDDGRIRASLPVIKKLADRGARVIVMAHLGRPKGEDFAERAAGGPSLRVVADRLKEWRPPRHCQIRDAAAWKAPCCAACPVSAAGAAPATGWRAFPCGA